MNKLIIGIISICILAIILFSSKYKNYKHKKEFLTNVYAELNETKPPNSLIEQSYFINSSIEAYWYIYNKYPSIKELKEFVEKGSIMLFEEELNLGISYNENKYILYDFGYDNLDGKGMNIHQFNEINFFSNLFSPKDIFLFSSKLRDTLEIVESSYLNYRDQPQLVNIETNHDFTLSKQENINDFLFKNKRSHD